MDGGTNAGHLEQGSANRSETRSPRPLESAIDGRTTGGVGSTRSNRKPGRMIRTLHFGRQAIQSHQILPSPDARHTRTCVWIVASSNCGRVEGWRGRLLLRAAKASPSRVLTGANIGLLVALPWGLGRLRRRRYYWSDRAIHRLECSTDHDRGRPITRWHQTSGPRPVLATHLPLDQVTSSWSCEDLPPAHSKILLVFSTSSPERAMWSGVVLSGDRDS